MRVDVVRSLLVPQPGSVTAGTPTLLGGRGLARPSAPKCPVLSGRRLCKFSEGAKPCCACLIDAPLGHILWSPPPNPCFQVQICTKFAPLPWRQTPGSLVGACRKSLQRLGVPKVALYIQHVSS